MRIAVLGLGAVGGHVCARLCAAGRNVTAIARGSTRRALEEDGLKLIAGDSTLECRPRQVASLAEAGEHDLVIVAMKATALDGETAEGLAGIVAAGGAILFLQNGIPWWYAIGREQGAADRQSRTAFADRLLETLPVQALFGGVVYSANEVVEPGVIVNNSPDRNAIIFGPVGKPESRRIRLVDEAFAGSGLDVRRAVDIRHAVWRKQLIVSSMPPLCIASGATPEGIRSSPAMRETFAAALLEVAQIADAEGFPLTHATDIGAILDGMPRHIPSMVKDFAEGRPLELDSALAAPLVLARKRGVATPVLDTLSAILEGRVRQRDASMAGGGA